MTTLVILAAGLATRYGAAKQLEPVGPHGETLFDYALFDAQAAGCRRAVFVIREQLREVFEQSVLPRWEGRLETRLAVQRLEDVPAGTPPGRVKPWGTAHAVLAAREHVAGDIAVCNADDFYGRGAYLALAAALRAHPGAHAVAGYPLAATLSPHGGVSRAVCVRDAGGRLAHVAERTGIVRSDAQIIDDRGDVLAADTLVSMNLWAFRPQFMTELARGFAEFVRGRGRDPGEELRIPDVVNEYRARGAGEVLVVPVEEHWFGMTYPEDREQVRAELRRLAPLYPAAGPGA
jgi:NDP-sugar pyrophosphorylase family protein